MADCDICLLAGADLYPIDGHMVCDRCLMQGRLDEIPDFAVMERHELELVGPGATVSSWWNRDIPASAGH